MDDLDDLLAGGDRFGDGLSGCLFLHRLDEIARDGQRHVGLEQGDADLAQGGFHVVFAERALFGQAVKDAGQAVGQIFEHGRRPFGWFRLVLEIRTDAPNDKRTSGRNALTGGDPAGGGTGKTWLSG